MCVYHLLSKESLSFMHKLAAIDTNLFFPYSLQAYDATNFITVIKLKISWADIMPLKCS